MSLHVFKYFLIPCVFFLYLVIPVNAETLIVGSGINGNTKVTNSINTWVDREWNSSTTYNESSWRNPVSFSPNSSNWDQWWHELPYTPNGSDPGTSYFSPRFPFFNRSSANVIQNSSIITTNGTKNYFRTRYKMPAGSKINKARVYVSVDDAAQVKLNGNTVDFSSYVIGRYPEYSPSDRYPTGCDRNYNPFNEVVALPVTQWVRGAPRGVTNSSTNYLANTDVTSLLQSALSRSSSGISDGDLVDMLISVEVMNSCVTDANESPMGVQYALYIDYTPPKNDPPVCGTVTKSPNQASYLPNTSITLTANSSDPEGKTVTYSNWRVKTGGSIKGVFTSSNIGRTVTYRTPSTGSNEVIEYTISDGTPSNTKQCTFSLSTQNKYVCNSNNQCLLDNNGNYSTLTDCLSNCESRFTCNSSFQCVPSTTGLYLNKASCDNACKSPSDSEVGCFRKDPIIFTKNGDTASIQAKVNNFTNLDTTYSWSSVYSNSSFFGSECISPKNCTMEVKNSAYTTPAISYKIPPSNVEDTITLTINNDPNKTCTYVVNGKNITLSFDKPVYSGSVNTPFDAVLTVQASNNFDVDYDLLLNCPGLNCLFKDTSTNTKRINFSQSSVSKRQDFIVTVTGANSGNGFNIQGIGTSLDGDSDLSKIAASKVNIYGPKSLSVNVKQVDNFLNKLSYCDSYNALQDLTGDATLSLNKGSLSIYSGSYKNASNTIALGTGYSFNISATNTDQEVYCTKVITDSQTYQSKSGPSTFNVISTDTNVTLIAVVGPKTTGGWFKAFGGNGHANSGYKNNIPSGEFFFDIYKNIQDGIVSAVDSIPNSNIAGFTKSGATISSGIAKQNHLSVFRGIFQKSIENTSYKDSINLSYDKNKSFDQYTLDKNSDKSKFYYLEVSDTLTINSDFKISDNKAVPILFVKSASNGNGGNVRITKDVSRLDLILIADGEVIIEDPALQCEEEVITDVTTFKAPYFMHVYKGAAGRFPIENYTLIPGLNGGPETYLIENKIAGNSEGYKIPKPSNANYVRVRGYWVQSGTGVQTNEDSKLVFSLADGVKVIDCPDHDGDTNIAVEDLKKIPQFCSSVEGEFYESSIDIKPVWDGRDQSSPGSHLVYVEVDWKKKTKETLQTCLSSDPNLVVNGAIIAKDTILMQSDNLVLQGSDASETFYFRPEVYFSDDETSEGFKSINIYLKTLD